MLSLPRIVELVNLSGVFLHIILPAECLIADFALEWFPTFVHDPDMFFEVAAPSEGLLAPVALERSFLPVYQSDVVIEGGFPGEFRVAFRAAVLRPALMNYTQVRL